MNTYFILYDKKLKIKSSYTTTKTNMETQRKTHSLHLTGSPTVYQIHRKLLSLPPRQSVFTATRLTEVPYDVHPFNGTTKDEHD